MTEETLSSIIEFDEDLTNVEAPKPLPAGTYDATIQSVEPMISRNTQRPMARITFAITADQYPADYADGNPNGTTLTHFVMLDNTARSKFMVKQFCMAIGAPLSNSIDLNTWIGLTGKIEVINEMYEGNPQARVRKVLN